MMRFTTRLAPTLCALLAACAKPVTPPVILAAPPVQPVRATPISPLAAPRKAVLQVVTVDHCPTLAEIRRLRAARPKPLRTQPMPASPAERVARTSAQLGQYEARGAWADQVDDALARCDP